MKYFKKLVGERIYLSPRNNEDVEIFTEWLNDFETTDYIGKSGKLISLETEKKYLEEHGNSEASFVIVTLNEDKMIGTISLEKIDHLHRRATLGIFIGDKEFRNNGYGAEAIRLILDFGFNYLNLNNIELRYLEFNERAKKCYEKCGFKEFGRRRKAEFVDGKFYDLVYMDILKEEFKERYIKNRNI